MNKAIGWLIIVIAVGVGIDAWHNKAPWSTILDYIQGKSTTPSAPSNAGDTSLTPFNTGAGISSGADSISNKQLAQNAQAGTASNNAPQGFSLTDPITKLTPRGF